MRKVQSPMGQLSVTDNGADNSAPPTFSLTQLRMEKLRRQCLSKFSTFVRVMWQTLNPGTELVWGTHRQAICDHLQAVAERVPGMRRLGIAIPPGQSKSTIASIFYPIWCWCRWPERRYISCTHTLSLSLKFNAKRLLLIRSERFQMIMRPSWTVGVDTAANKSLLQNTRMGEIMATAIGAGITGNHGQELLIDDPLTPEQAISLQRHRHVEYIEDTLHSRLVPRDNPIIVTIMQRLCQGDIFDVYDKQGKFDAKIVLSAEYDSKIDPGPTPLGWYDARKPGELLDPIMLPQSLCDDLKLRPRLWRTQYQQCPEDEEGSIIKASWFNSYHKQHLPQGKLVGAWDTTFSDDGKDPDLNVGVVLAIVKGEAYVVDCVYGKWAFPELIKKMKALSEKHPNVSRWYIEKKANGAAAISTLRREIPGLLPWTSSSPKDIRIATVSGAIEAGNVYLPDPNTCSKEDANWVGEMKAQCGGYPNVRYDDMPDALSIALLAERIAVGEVQQSINHVQRPRPSKVNGSVNKKPPNAWR